MAVCLYHLVHLIQHDHGMEHAVDAGDLDVNDAGHDQRFERASAPAISSRYGHYQHASAGGGRDRYRTAGHRDDQKLRTLLERAAAAKEAAGLQIPAMMAGMKSAFLLAFGLVAIAWTISFFFLNEPRRRKGIRKASECLHTRACGFNRIEIP